MLQGCNKAGLEHRQLVIGKPQRCDDMRVNAGRVINGLGLDLQRFGIQKPAGNADAVAAHIHQRPPAHIRLQPNVGTALKYVFIHAETKR